MEIPNVIFKRGTYELNADPNFNFQLNRVIQWDGGRLEDVKPVAADIHSSADWKRHLIALGNAAMAENRMENAIAYYRMSEFFITTAIQTKLLSTKRPQSCSTIFTVRILTAAW